MGMKVFENFEVSPIKSPLGIALRFRDSDTNEMYLFDFSTEQFDKVVAAAQAVLITVPASAMPKENSGDKRA